MNEIDNLIIARDEMRDLYQKSIEANDILTKKASLILGTIGILFSLATFLNIEEKIRRGCSIYYWIILAFSFVLFMILIIATIFIVLPRTYQTPIKPTLNVIQHELIEQTNEIALRKIIRGYIDAIDINVKTNLRKAKVVKFGLIVFPIIIFLLILLFFIP